MKDMTSTTQKLTNFKYRKLKLFQQCQSGGIPKSIVLEIEKLTKDKKKCLSLLESLHFLGLLKDYEGRINNLIDLIASSSSEKDKQKKEEKEKLRLLLMTAIFIAKDYVRLGHPGKKGLKDIHTYCRSLLNHYCLRMDQDLTVDSIKEYLENETKNLLSGKGQYCSSTTGNKAGRAFFFNLHENVPIRNVKTRGCRFVIKERPSLKRAAHSQTSLWIVILFSILLAILSMGTIFVPGLAPALLILAPIFKLVAGSSTAALLSYDIMAVIYTFLPTFPAVIRALLKGTKSSIESVKIEIIGFSKKQNTTKRRLTKSTTQSTKIHPFNIDSTCST